MNKDFIQKIAQQVYRQNDTVNQFGVSNTPFHTHNGVDSPRIQASNLSGDVGESFSDIAIWGSGTMSGGILDITDSRIVSSSIGLAIRANAAATAGGFAQLSAGHPAAPQTIRFFEGSFSASWDLYYLIIF